MKKRIIAFALCFVMLLGCLGMGLDLTTTGDEDTALVPEVTEPVNEEPVVDDIDADAPETESSLYDALMAAETATKFDEIASAASEEAIAALSADQVNALEQRYAELNPNNDTENGVLHCVNFTNVAPLVQSNNSVPARKMLARSAKAGTDNPGVETSKNVIVNADGTYTLRLETYVTGSTQTVVTQKPTDIVLVLDTSGSMDDNIALAEINTVAGLSTIREILDDARVYLGDDTTYKWGSWNVKWTTPKDSNVYQWCTYNPWASWNGWITLEEGLKTSGDFNFYMKRIDALKIAALKFIESAAKNGGDNRIAIVTFANKAQTKNDLSAVPEKTNELKNTIKGLEANGATAADYGMEYAQTIINGIDTNRDSNKVVIMFTDGDPMHQNWPSGDGAGFETVANNTIDISKSLKQKGTTVYTIGVLNGADPTKNPGGLSKTDINKYLHYVSSNYLTADSTSDNNLPLNPNADPFNGGRSYYLSANNSADLADAFENISSEIGGAATKLDSSTTVRDVISDYFKLPDGASANITVKTADCNSFTGDTPIWTNEKTADLTPTIDGKTVKVEGFNFSEHWVGKDTTTGDVHPGKKLIIEIPIVPETGFLGGNNVPTNGDASGVYDKDGTLVENYEVPEANVPINLPDFTAKDANVYLYGDTPQVSDLCNKITYADKMADFVNITYAIDKDVSNTKDGTYKITATATPTEDGTGAEGTVQKAVSKDATATVNVFKPEITYQDSKIDLGQTPDYATENFGSVAWKHGNDDSETVTMTGTAPKLSYEYDPAAEAFQTDTYVNVTVKIGDSDITEEVTFMHNDCDYDGCKFDSTEGEFIVHIKTFDLTISKSGWESIDKNQSFVFNIVCADKNINMQVVIVGNDSVTIKGLPVGTYTITEDANWSWRYELTAVNAADSTGNCTKIDNGCTYTPSGTNNSILFTNSRIQQQWLSFVDNVKNVFQ